MWHVLVFLLICVAAEDFTGHRLVSIRARTRSDLDFLNSLGDSPEFEGLDFWTDLSIYQPVEVRVTPNDYERFQETLRNVGLTFHVINNNIQDMIDEERKSMTKVPRIGLCDPLLTYCTFEQIEAWLINKANNNQNRMQLTTMNQKTSEGRFIYQVKIAEDLNNPKEAIWIEAGTHAREWISVSSALVLILKLLDETNGYSSLMLSQYDWYIAPVHNPDGYVYSHVSINILRRIEYGEKNRQNCGFFGVGTDSNRNWDANFGGPGSSSSCFSDTYRGTAAFSAPETAALRDAVTSMLGNVKAFFSIHCYSQFFLVPYGYTYTHPGRYDHLMEVAEEMMKWLETVNGTYFLTGTPPDILYEASGGAYDYFYTQGVPYAYTYELRPKNGTNNGFVLDPALIPVATEELFISLWSFATLTNLNWGTESSHP